MMEIPLTKNKVALVSDCDFDWISQWSWRAALKRRQMIWYAARTELGKDGRLFSVSMHRLITNCPQDLEVDHIDGDGLNNQRDNLQICTRSQNNTNSFLRRKLGGPIRFGESRDHAARISGIPYVRKTPSGFYWEPSAKLRAMGFASIPLGKVAGSIEAAASSLNARVRAAIILANINSTASENPVIPRRK